MARNRKNQAIAFRLGPPIKAVLLCFFIGGSGIGYVWQKAVIDQLGQDIKKREGRLEAMEYQNERYRKQLAGMQSPTMLEMRIKDLNLGLAMPHPSQILRLQEPLPAQPQPPEAERKYASWEESRAQ